MAPLPHFGQPKSSTYGFCGCSDCNTHIPVDTHILKINMLKTTVDKIFCYPCARKTTIKKLYSLL